MELKAVIDGEERDVPIGNLSPEATDREILAHVEGYSERTLSNHIVRREEGRVLVSPSPSFG